MARSLAEIQLDLDAAYTARRAAMTAQSYTIGQRTVARGQLDTLNRTISNLENEKAAATNAANGQGSIAFVPTMRGW